MITFAVVGHNEEALVERALGQALDATEPGDRVVFVDSGSTDGSAAVATGLGVEVLEAPLGKGAAVAALLGSVDRGRVCLTDGDLESCESNIPLALADAWRDEAADLIVGDFSWPEKGFLVSTTVIYEPLVEALFPEAAGRYGSKPLSGFRLFEPGLVRGPLPSGFALEAYLNVQFAIDGRRIRLIDLGRYRAPVRPKPILSQEVGDALLDLAESEGRIGQSERRDWDDWLLSGVELAREQPSPESDYDSYVEEMKRAARRPRPPAVNR